MEVVDDDEYPHEHRRILFRAYAEYRWLETWALPRFYAKDRPVVKRRRVD